MAHGARVSACHHDAGARKRGVACADEAKAGRTARAARDLTARHADARAQSFGPRSIDSEPGWKEHRRAAFRFFLAFAMEAGLAAFFGFLTEAGAAGRPYASIVALKGFGDPLRSFRALAQSFDVALERFGKPSQGNGSLVGAYPEDRVWAVSTE